MAPKVLFWDLETTGLDDDCAATVGVVGDEAAVRELGFPRCQRGVDGVLPRREGGVDRGHGC